MRKYKRKSDKEPVALEVVLKTIKMVYEEKVSVRKASECYGVDRSSVGRYMKYVTADIISDEPECYRLLCRARDQKKKGMVIYKIFMFSIAIRLNANMLLSILFRLSHVSKKKHWYHICYSVRTHILVWPRVKCVFWHINMPRKWI